MPRAVYPLDVCRALTIGVRELRRIARASPLGEYLVPITGDITQWILNVLNASVRRAILIGVSLGAVALSLKIIFGMERSYLGGGKE